MSSQDWIVLGGFAIWALCFPIAAKVQDRYGDGAAMLLGVAGSIVLVTCVLIARK